MISLFREKSFESVKNILDTNIETRVNSIVKTTIIHSDLTKLNEEIAKTMKIKTINIDLEDRETVIILEKLIGKQLPPGYDVYPDEETMRAKVHFNFKVKSGEMNLLNIIPTRNYMSEIVPATVSNNTFSIGYQTYSQSETLTEDEKNEVKEWRKKIVIEIRNALDEINTKIEIYNSEIPNKVQILLENRYNFFKSQDDQNNDLNN